MEKFEIASDAPLRLYEARVRSEWVDYNAHMSEAFYVLVFGRATDTFLDLIGMDSGYRERSGMSLYTMEIHVSYLQEVSEGEPLEIATQLLDLDHKRARLFYEMRHAQNGTLLATEEAMLLNVYRLGPRSAPFPEEVAARLREIEKAHSLLPRPEQAGRSIAIRR